MGGIDKQLMPLADAPVLVHTLQRLGELPICRRNHCSDKRTIYPDFTSDDRRF
ncbi:MAG: hypothetical protein V8T62_01580 [Oscillospiraceae bacterium]